MEDYTEIINAYMNFFACHLLESVDDTKTKMYFEDVYSFKKQFDKNVEKCIYELHIPDIYSSEEKDMHWKIKWQSCFMFLQKKI